MGVLWLEILPDIVEYWKSYYSASIKGADDSFQWL